MSKIADVIRSRFTKANLMTLTLTFGVVFLAMFLLGCASNVPEGETPSLVGDGGEQQMCYRDCNSSDELVAELVRISERCDCSKYEQED